MKRRRYGLGCAILISLAIPAPADEATSTSWSSWRGPSGQGYSDDQHVPLRWSAKENVLWKTPLPGRGNSTPIIWGRRVFLTSASADGSERFLHCIDAHDGTMLWRRLVSKGAPAGKSHPWNGYASASCVTDGERVYAFFGTPGLFCYDMDGKQLWKHEFGVFTSATGWGSAASPFLFEDLVIQNCDNDGEAGLRADKKGAMAAPMSLVALDKRTGKVRWSTPRNQGRGFSTPRLVSTAAAKIELVLNGPDGLWAYEPKTGKEIWHCRRSAEKGQGKFGEPMPVGDRDALVAFSGRPGPVQAIRPGANGDVLPTHRLWEIRRKGRDVASPILWRDHLYAVDNRAVLTCFEVKTGKAIYSKRLSPDARALASAVAVRGKLLFLLDTGETVVVEPGATYREVGRNILGENRSLDFAASPAIAGGKLYLRSQSHLYCIGEAKANSATAVPVYPDKSNLLVWRDANGKDHAIKSAADWTKRRAHIVANMEKVMGPLPGAGKKVPLDVKYLDEVKTPRFIRKKLSFAVGKNDRVPGYLFIPIGIEGKVPGIICLHQTNGALGSKEPSGLGGLPSLHYALHLVERGYVTLAIDYPSFGEYPFDFKKSELASGSMKAIWNNMRAIDLLQSLPEVDGARIGCIGHSLGGHNTMYTAVFDLRIKALVSNCGFNSFPKYYKGDLRGWTSDRYMPRIAKLYDSSPAKVPFDFPEVVAAFAPRAFLASSPVRDSNFEVSGVKDCIAAALPVYELLGAKDRLAVNYPDCAHDFPPEVRKTAYEFLDRFLKGGGRR